MQKKIKLKKFGDKQWQDAVLALPDTALILDPYTIELVEYTGFGESGSIFIYKDKEEHEQVYKYSMNNPDSIKSAFKRIVGDLAPLTTLTLSAS